MIASSIWYKSKRNYVYREVNNFCLKEILDYTAVFLNKEAGSILILNPNALQQNEKNIGVVYIRRNRIFNDAAPEYFYNHIRIEILVQLPHL